MEGIDIRTMYPKVTRLLPAIVCPICGEHDLQEFRMRDSTGGLVLAWVCICDEYKKLLAIAKEQMIR